MEQLLDTKSIPALLVTIAVFLCAHVIKGVIEFLWQIKEKKDSASETAVENLTKAVQGNTTATEHLDQRIKELETVLAEIPKLKLDMRRMFAAIKIASGERWAQIRKEIMEDI